MLSNHLCKVTHFFAHLHPYFVIFCLQTETDWLILFFYGFLVWCLSKLIDGLISFPLGPNQVAGVNVC